MNSIERLLGQREGPCICQPNEFIYLFSHSTMTTLTPNIKAEKEELEEGPKDKECNAKTKPAGLPVQLGIKSVYSFFPMHFLVTQLQRNATNACKWTWPFKGHWQMPWQW